MSYSVDIYHQSRPRMGVSVMVMRAVMAIILFSHNLFIPPSQVLFILIFLALEAPLGRSRTPVVRNGR